MWNKEISSVSHSGGGVLFNTEWESFISLKWNIFSSGD